jgi:3-deoxy-D-manno-octulosonic acid kinase
VRPDLATVALDALWAEPEPLAGAKGRGGVGRLLVAGVDCVARPYRRGGALAALLRDRYASPRRARDELLALHALRQDGVPVVTPVAALARRHGAFWRLRLLTERVDGALPLPAFLAAQPGARRAAAAGVGTVLRLAFAAGLRHPDLHADNVLCALRGDRLRIALVDLDRAVVRAPLAPRDREAMLARLQRYWWKHGATLPACATRAETMRGLAAILPERAERHAAWRRIAGAASRGLGRKPSRR